MYVLGNVYFIVLFDFKLSFRLAKRFVCTSKTLLYYEYILFNSYTFLCVLHFVSR